MELLPGEESNSVEHDLTFFVQDPKKMCTIGLTNVTCNAYQVEELTKWLEEAGFTVLRVTGDFERLEVTEQTERIFFMAKKRIKQKQPRRLLLFYKEDVFLVLA